MDFINRTHNTNLINRVNSKKVVFTDLKDKFFPKNMKISIKSVFCVLYQKMAIFGHQYGLYPITRQRTGIVLRCMFRWKALVISFSKIHKSIYKN